MKQEQAEHKNPENTGSRQFFSPACTFSATRRLTRAWAPHPYVEYPALSHFVFDLFVFFG
jgi:hypothetical protein